MLKSAYGEINGWIELKLSRDFLDSFVCWIENKGGFMADYNETKVQKNKKGNYYLTTDVTDEKQNVFLQNFIPTSQKGVNITVNSTYSGGNLINTSMFNDIITAKNARANIYLNGIMGKKITTGDYNDTVHIENDGKNTINLGNGENEIITTQGNTTNTIITGIDTDTYQINGATNKITDKGGNNSFTINTNYSTNTITASGNNAFTISAQSKNTIKTGYGSDEFNIYSYSNNSITSSIFGSCFNVGTFLLLITTSSFSFKYLFSSSADLKSILIPLFQSLFPQLQMEDSL